jgi:hypothetical protein
MKRAQLSLFLSLAIVLAYQGCGNHLSFISPESIAANKSENNGDGYTGKPSPYDFRTSTEPCLDKGANGKSLPNAQIFIFPTGGAQLVREQCADITPRPLSSQEYTVLPNGDLMYQNQTYASNLNLGDFDVVAASCPPGKSVLANPVRESLIAPPLYLQDSGWAHPGLTINWDGTLASLPVYKIERTNPNQLQAYNRMNASLRMNANETYVFSFFAKTDPTEKVLFTAYYPNNHDFRVEFDLLTGSPTVQSISGVNLIGTHKLELLVAVCISIFIIN